MIALSAWLNVALRLRFHMTQRLEPDRAAWLLAFDTAELAVLLFLTGGLQNPFAFLFLGPVLLSATALPPRFTLMLGAFAVACATRAGVRALSAALGSRRSAEAAADLYDGRMARDPARHGLHRRLCLADHRGIAPARRRARRHRAGAGARAASLAARRAGRRRRARARHAAVDHLGDRQGTAERHSRRRAAWRRRAAVARAGHALPRHPRQAHRIVVERRAVRPHAAHRADRGSGGAAPQFRRRHRRRAAGRRARPSRSARAIRRSSTGSAIFWRTPSISRASAWWSTPPGTRTRSRSPSATTAPASRRKSWTASASPMSPAAGASPATADEEPRGLGLGFFIAKTLLERSGATLIFENRALPARGAVVTLRWNRERFRARVDLRGGLRSRRSITICH